MEPVTIDQHTVPDRWALPPDVVESWNAETQRWECYRRNNGGDPVRVELEEAVVKHMLDRMGRSYNLLHRGFDLREVRELAPQWRLHNEVFNLILRTKYATIGSQHAVLDNTLDGGWRILGWPALLDFTLPVHLDRHPYVELGWAVPLG